MFITFEGLDGAGKSTQSSILAERLRSEGKVVTLVREPGGTPVGDAINDILNTPELAVNARARLLLHSAARAQLVDDVIAPALRRGEIVICDSFTDASFAYQGAGDGLPSLSICNIVDFSTHCAKFHLTPDRTFLLSIPPEVAALRRIACGERSDSFKSADFDYMRRVDTAFRGLRHFRRMVIIDADREREVIADEIYEKLPLSVSRAPALV